jgi:bla regulator protein BlaR1
VIAYLIKSAFCLALLLAVYHFSLEKEAIHRFKRMFLLASLAFSLTIPLISINIAMPESPVADITRLAPITGFMPDDTANETISPGTTVVITTPQGLLLQDYLLIIYIGITAILLLRFGINLIAILIKTRRNEHVPIDGGTLVLINGSIIPNSFLQYIFVNRDEFLSHQLEPELLMHELVHARQKHSLDIILIELLKAILWFNPLFILYKKAIQLNHEFLADDGVIKANIDVKGYQNLLLTKAGLQSNFALASNFNYSVTKKRMIMMKTSTTKLRAMLKELALFPLMIVLTAIVCVKAEAQQPASQQSIPAKAYQPKAPKKQGPIVVYADHFPTDSVFIHFYNKKDGVRSIKALSELPPAEQAKFLMSTKKFPMTAKRTPTVKQFADWKDASSYGVWLDGKHIKNNILDTYKATDFVMYYHSKLYGAAKKGRVYSYQIDLYTPAYYEKVKEEVTNENNTKTRADIFSMVK